MADQRVADHDRTADPVPVMAAAPNGQPADTAGQLARIRAQFSERIASSRARFQQAVAEMQNAAEAMTAAGRPPSYRLVQLLGDCHREWLRLRHDLVASARADSLAVPELGELDGIESLARWLGVPPASPPTLAPRTALPEVLPVEIPPGPEPTPTPAVDNLLPAPPAEAVEPETPIAEPAVEAEHPDEAIRRAALERIETVLRLRVRDGADFSPLNDCQAHARSLLERIATTPAADLPTEAADLARGDHPLAGLLTVVSGIESLNDSQWASVHASVSEAFGRPLAVAAARGRLVVGPARV